MPARDVQLVLFVAGSEGLRRSALNVVLDDLDEVHALNPEIGVKAAAEPLMLTHRPPTAGLTTGLCTTRTLGSSTTMGASRSTPLMRTLRATPNGSA